MHRGGGMPAPVQGSRLSSGIFCGGLCAGVCKCAFKSNHPPLGGCSFATLAALSFHPCVASVFVGLFLGVVARGCCGCGFSCFPWVRGCLFVCG